MKRLIAVILMLSSMAACSSIEDIPDLFGVISGTVMHKEQPVEGVEEVKDAIKRVARLTLDFPEISELDINPIFVYEEGSSALDIKIKL